MIRYGQTMRHYPYLRNTHARLLLDQSWCGFRAVTLQNRWVRVTVLPEKGGDIVEWLHKPSDTDVLFLTPLGLRRTDHAEPSIGGPPGTYMERYEGGWQEIFPAAGPPSRYAGAEFGQHGEASVLPWRCELLADTPREVAIKLTVQTIRTPFLLERIMRLRDDEPTLFIEETMHNLSPQRLALMWGHHPTFGGGFLDESCKLEFPGLSRPLRVEAPDWLEFPTQRLAPGTVGEWPIVPGRNGERIDLSGMPPPAARTADYLFITGLEQGRYRLTNQRLKLAVDMRWDHNVMPHIWLWQVAHGAFDYPWWGQTYNWALEPFTSKINNYQKALARNDLLWLDGNSKREFFLNATLSNT